MKLDKNKMEESQEIEFKKSLAERKEMLETISAFANSKGGKIFVGMEENKNGTVKEIVGIRIKGKELENLSNEVRQNTDPVIFPSIEIEKRFLNLWNWKLLNCEGKGRGAHYALS